MSDYEYMEIPKDLYDSLEIIAKEHSIPVNKLFEKLLEIQLDKLESGENLGFTRWDIERILNC